MNAGPPQPDPADAALIRQFLNGDEAAFRCLYRRHTPRLRMLMLRLMGYRDADTDDALQETWLACCCALPSFRGESRFDTWLTTIGIRTARRRLSVVLAQPDSMHLSATRALSHGRLAIEASIDGERALARLTDRDRIVFTLFHLHGLSHDEIARELGIGTSTSRAILSRALSRLRADFPREVTHGE